MDTPESSQPIKPFRLYRVGLNDALIMLVAQADSRRELWKVHHRQSDWKYAIVHNGERIWPKLRRPRQTSRPSPRPRKTGSNPR
jgi:hypothetical protein